MQVNNVFHVSSLTLQDSMPKALNQRLKTCGSHRALATWKSMWKPLQKWVTVEKMVFFILYEDAKNDIPQYHIVSAYTIGDKIFMLRNKLIK